MKLGTVGDKMTAELAKEVLKSSDIPAVVISRSGFFGDVGLTLWNVYSGKPGLFEVSVPADLADDAAEILDATLGEQWQRAKEDEQ